MKYKLEDICEYVKGKVDIASLDDETYISTENMAPNKGGVTKASSIPTISQTQAFIAGDILVSNIRPYFKKIWIAEFDGGCSNDVLVFRAKDGVSKRFLYYVLANDSFFDYAMVTSKGTKMPRGDKKALMQYGVPDFSIEEQEAIAGILRGLDKKIQLNTSINENLSQQIQFIYDNLADGLTGDPFDLSTIIDVRDGTHDSPKAVEEGFPLVTSKHLLPYGVDLSTANLISKEDFDKTNERSLVETHDILISMIGTVGLISLVIDDPVPFAIKNVGLFKTSKCPELYADLSKKHKNYSTH